jgi:hypothetical protein
VIRALCCGLQAFVGFRDRFSVFPCVVDGSDFGAITHNVNDYLEPITDNRKPTAYLSYTSVVLRLRKCLEQAASIQSAFGRFFMLQERIDLALFGGIC